MTTDATATATMPRSAIARFLGTSAGLAVSIMVMNFATYGFQMLAARMLGPEAYGSIASLLAVCLVVAVLQLGVQATAARRVAANPDDVSGIEHVIRQVAWRSGVVLALVLLVAAPLTERLLHLQSIYPALMVAASAIPLTMFGAQAGILQGERRWLPLGILYLFNGVPRLLLGIPAMMIRPTEGSAMLAVLLGMIAPVVFGWFALRRPDTAPGHGFRPVLAETAASSVALLGFFVLSNADIVMSRNVLSSTDSGLYAGGLILTKAVLFLPQFVVVVAFPSMSTAEERRGALTKSLALVGGLGALAVLGAWILAPVAMIFVGGGQYSAVEHRLWLFAVLGTLLSALQLLVYAVLARQGKFSAGLVWVAVAAVVGIVSLTVSTLDGLVLTVSCVDALLAAVLLAISMWHMRHDAV